MKNVIYKIRNVVNGKFYVGSTVDARIRFQAHKRRLKNGTHQSPHMQAAWDKYGEDCFKFEVVEIVSEMSELLAAEQVWLDNHVGKPHCYNWASDASAPMRGKKHTEEARVKLKIAAASVPRGTESVLYRVPRTEETKAKISAKCKGLPNPMKGKHHSEQSRANMKASVKRGEDCHFYGQRPKSADITQKAILAIKPDRSQETYISMAYMRDNLGVSMPAIIRACRSGSPIRQGICAGWVLSYVEGAQNEAPNIPKEFLIYARTRAEAKARGDKYYFTGLPCDRGHIGPRKTKGTCIACMKEDYKKGNDKRKKIVK